MLFLHLPSKSNKQTKKYKQICLFLLVILNGRTSRQRGNLASKENEQTLANLSSAEEATREVEVEIEKFLQAQKSRNTQYKTKSDLNAWTKFCELLKESRAIVNIPAKELVLLLSKFFISVRKTR